MDIQFLSYLEQIASHDKTQSLKGMAVQQIVALEKIYNKTEPFPQALRELLFLSGHSCFALNRLWYKSQQEIQTAAREWLMEYNISIGRPFFVIAVDHIGVPFTYVHLDEGNNPLVYQTDIIRNNGKMTIKNLELNLSTYIRNCIEKRKPPIAAV